MYFDSALKREYLFDVLETYAKLYFILHSFVDRIYIGETEVYEGQKLQDIKIVYNLVGAIDLPQYAM